MTQSFPVEKDFAYPVPMETSLFNERGALAIASYQHILTSLMEKHLLAVGMDVPSMIKKYGVTWVLLSMNLEIARPVRREENIIARTWNTTKKTPVYRRDIALFDETGARVVAGANFFALFDPEKRKLCTDPSVYAHISLPEGEELIEASSRFSDEGLGFFEVEKRSVRPSWIDGLGHVNNVRYGEIAYDALTETERAGMDRLRRLELYFIHELRPGDEVVMERAEGDGALYLRGSILPEGGPSFAIKMRFED